MNSLNSSAWKDLFVPTVSRKNVDIVDEMDEFIRRADTPDLFLKSTGKNRNLMDRSVFNFSYADINQMMPDIPTEMEVSNLPEMETAPDMAVEEDEKDEKEEKEEKEERTSSVSADVRTKRPKVLERVYETLNCIFTDKGIELKDVELNDVESELLKCVVAKKYAGESGGISRRELGAAKGAELLNLINELQSGFKTKKRKEEKIKFVFKHSLKNLKKAFFKDLGIPHLPENESKFFAHYFHGHDANTSIPIEHFFDPLNTSSANNPRYKTLSKDYMLLLFSYGDFKQDFMKYIQEFLLDEYQSKVNRKFKKLLKKLRKKLRTASGTKITEIIREFITKFDENKRCKLPWTTIEITDAIKCFEEHITALAKIR